MVPFRTRHGSMIFVATVALLLPAVLPAAPERLRAGQWEFTTSHVDGEPDSVKFCVSPEEAASINGGAATGRAYAEKKAREGCKVNDYSVNGNVVTYSVTCGGTSVRTKVTYAGDNSEGETVIQRQGQKDIVLHVKAKRLGDCPPGEADKP